MGTATPTVDQPAIYNFCSSVANVIHLSNPLHLIFRFELFGDTLTLCHLFYEPKKHILYLLVNVSEVSVQLATCQQISVEHLSVLLDVHLTDNGGKEIKFSLPSF